MKKDEIAGGQAISRPDPDWFAEFVDFGNCSIMADALVASPLGRSLGLRIEDGFFCSPEGGGHTWTVAPDGTIIDTTYSQFDSRLAVNVVRPGEDTYDEYVPERCMTDAEYEEVYRQPRSARAPVVPSVDAYLPAEEFSPGSEGEFVPR